MRYEIVEDDMEAIRDSKEALITMKLEQRREDVKKALEAKKRLKATNTTRKTNKTVTSTNRGTTIDNKELLYYVVEAEAGIESYVGKLAVANVILNRVKHTSFPNSVKGVLYQRNQFESVSKGLRKKPSNDTIKAVNEVLNGKRVFGSDVLYFYNPTITSKSNWIRKRPVVKSIGRHLFCR